MTLFNNWNLWVNMEKGTFTFPQFVALDAYWPGLLVSHVDTQIMLTHSLHRRWCHWLVTGHRIAFVTVECCCEPSLWHMSEFVVLLVCL